MAVRPGDWMVEVELVDDDGRTPSAPAVPDGAVQGPAEPADDAPRAPSWLRRNGRRLVAGAATGAVVVVGVVVAADMRDGEEEDTATVSLGHPIEEQWTVPASDVLGTADGVVVLRAASVLTGVEVETGVERWRLELGRDGPVDGCAAAVTADPGTLWCWRSLMGSVEAATGEEIREAGMVGIDLADGTVVAEHTVRIPSSGYVAVDEDVVIGERRGSVLTLARVEPHTWSAEWEVRLDLEPRVAGRQHDATIESAAGLVVVHGPTTAVVDPADGAVLATWPPVDDPIRFQVDGADVTVTEHGFAAATALADGVRLPEGVWYGRGGEVRAVFQGVLAEPAASDGSEPGVLLVTRSDGQTLVGVDARSGEDRWTFPLRGGRTLARQDGTVVVATDDEVVCLELLTGWTRWRDDVAGLRSDAGGVSDGSVVVVMAVQDREWIMEAFAVGSGERLWSARAPGTPNLDELFIAVALELRMLAGRPVIESGGTLTWMG